MKAQLNKSKIHDHLSFIYGEALAISVAEKLDQLLATYREKLPAPDTQRRFDETDAILITYGDMVRASGETPLATLALFVEKHLQGVVSTVHLLPFFPYSSDDGFFSHRLQKGRPQSR